ncbi:unnamed protein product [Sympodiomycopsis kandeliae]
MEARIRRGHLSSPTQQAEPPPPGLKRKDRQDANQKAVETGKKRVAKSDASAIRSGIFAMADRNQGKNKVQTNVSSSPPSSSPPQSSASSSSMRDPFENHKPRTASTSTFAAMTFPQSSQSNIGDDDEDTTSGMASSSPPAWPTKKTKQGIVLPPKSRHAGGNTTATEMKATKALASNASAIGDETLRLITSHASSQDTSTPANADSSQSSKTTETVPKLVKDLLECPFCLRKMPARPSQHLRTLMQPYLDDYHAEKHVKLTDLVTTCSRHEEEYAIVPNGKKAGYPTSHNWTVVTKRVHAQKEALHRIVQDQEKSWFFTNAKEKRLHKRRGAMEASEAMEQTQTGYYGEVGWELFRSILFKWLGIARKSEESSNESQISSLSSLSSPPSPAWNLTDANLMQKITPMTIYDFLDLVLIPELTCLLLIEDERRKGHSITFTQAHELKKQSSPFGIAMFSVDSIGHNDSPPQPTTREFKRVVSSQPLSNKTLAIKGGGRTPSTSQPPRPRPVIPTGKDDASSDTDSFFDRSKTTTVKRAAGFDDFFGSGSGSKKK